MGIYTKLSSLPLPPRFSPQGKRIDLLTMVWNSSVWIKIVIGYGILALFSLIIVPLLFQFYMQPLRQLSKTQTAPRLDKADFQEAYAKAYTYWKISPLVAMFVVFIGSSSLLLFTGHFGTQWNIVTALERIGILLLTLLTFGQVFIYALVIAPWTLIMIGTHSVPFPAPLETNSLSLRQLLRRTNPIYSFSHALDSFLVGDEVYRTGISILIRATAVILLSILGNWLVLTRY